MPNWCYTRIIFHGSKPEIEDFYKKVDEWTSKPLSGNDFGRGWLGNILIHAGLKDRIDSENAQLRLRCRGAIIYLDEVQDDGDTDALFALDTETAWAPMMNMWVEVIKALNYKTIGFSYQAEEPGCEVYQIYDPYGDFPERYYVDVYIEGEDMKNEKLRKLDDERYYESDGLLRRALQDIFEEDVELSLDTLIEKAQTYPFKDEETYISIHKYEILSGDEIY